MRIRHSKPTIIIAYLVLFLWCSFTIFAFFWITLTSLKDNRTLFQNVWALPQELHFENYELIWNTFDLKNYFKNSIIVVPISVFMILVFAAPAAYVLSRARFKGMNILLNFFVIGIGVPFVVLLIPLYFLLTRLQIIDTLFGLSIVYISLSLPFSIFLLTGFFRSFPSELEEAAAIDGCKPFQTFLKVVLPITSPGMIAVSIFNFIGIWNEYLLALVLTNSEGNRLLSLGVYAIQNSMQYSGNWVALFAGIVIVFLPTLIFYIFMSERIMEGLTLGAVKG